MNKSRWVFFRVAVYLCLVIAILFMMGMFYFGARVGRMSADEWIIYGLILLIPATQVAFQLLNARLLHFFMPENVLPGYTFKTWHSILLCVNAVCVIIIGFAIIAALTAVGVQQQVHNRPQSFFWQYLVIGSVTAIAVVNLYTITASLQLRGYLRRQYVSAENKWLDNIGNT